MISLKNTQSVLRFTGQMTCGSMLRPPTPVALVRIPSNQVTRLNQYESTHESYNQAPIGVSGELFSPIV